MTRSPSPLLRYLSAGVSALALTAAAASAWAQDPAPQAAAATVADDPDEDPYEVDGRPFLAS